MLSRFKTISAEFYLIVFVLLISTAATHSIICFIHDNTYTIEMANADKQQLNNQIDTLRIELKKMNDSFTLDMAKVAKQQIVSQFDSLHIKIDELDDMYTVEMAKIDKQLFNNQIDTLRDDIQELKNKLP